MLDSKSLIIGAIGGAIAGAAALRGGQYYKEVQEFKRMKKILGLNTEAKTAKQYAREMAEEMKRAGVVF